MYFTQALLLASAVFIMDWTLQLQPVNSFPIAQNAKNKICWKNHETNKHINLHKKVKRQAVENEIIGADEIPDDITNEKLQEAIEILTKKKKRCVNSTGTFSHPTDCSRYYVCTVINNSLREFTKECGHFEVFDEYLSKCVSATEVNLKSRCVPEAQKIIESSFNGSGAVGDAEDNNEASVTSTTTEKPTSQTTTTEISQVFENTNQESSSADSPEDYDSDESYKDSEEIPQGTPFSTPAPDTSAVLTSTTQQPRIISSEEFNNSDKNDDDFHIPQHPQPPNFDAEADTDKNNSLVTTTPEPIIIGEQESSSESYNKTFLPISDSNIIVEKKKAASESTFLTLFSSNSQISLAITIVLFILFIVIFFCCCYLLRGLYHLAFLAKTDNQNSTASVYFRKPARRNSLNDASSSYKRYPSITSSPNYFPKEMEETDDSEPIELKSIIIRRQSIPSATMIGKETITASSSSTAAEADVSTQFSTFEVQKPKNIEINPSNPLSQQVEQDSNITNKVVILNDVEDYPKHDDAEVEKVNKRKKVEIYIPNLNLPNVREPFYVRSMTDEIEDEYFKAMETNELILSPPVAGDYEKPVEDDFVMPEKDDPCFVDVNSSQRNSTFGQSSNGRIAHVSPFTKKNQNEYDNACIDNKKQDNGDSQQQRLSQDWYASGLPKDSKVDEDPNPIRNQPQEYFM